MQIFAYLSLFSMLHATCRANNAAVFEEGTRDAKKSHEPRIETVVKFRESNLHKNKARPPP